MKTLMPDTTLTVREKAVGTSPSAFEIFFSHFEARHRGERVKDDGSI